MSTLVDAKNITKVYHAGNVEVPALNGVDLQVEEGEFSVLVGPSGSGKTTFLNLIGALDTQTAGTLTVLSKDLTQLSKRERADLRLRSMGFVFQAFNLVPVLTARENVEFVLELQGAGNERKKNAMEILDELGLAELANRRPNEMSGGQQQRVAVARAVASRPRLVLADEPTASLDGKSAEALLQMMLKLNKDHGTTFIFSTHDPRVVSYAKRVVNLADGLITSCEDR
jgi:putative ABC transport system ATP-binding protein